MYQLAQIRVILQVLQDTPHNAIDFQNTTKLQIHYVITDGPGIKKLFTKIN